MTTNPTPQAWRASLAWSAVCRASRLVIFGVIGWLWLLSADDSAWRTVSLVAVLALAALVAITWYLVAPAPKGGGGLPSIATRSRKWRRALTHRGGKILEGDSQ